MITRMTPVRCLTIRCRESERKIGTALIRYPAWKDSSFRCTPGDYWRISAYPEVIPQKCSSVRIGDKPTAMYARRINVLRSPLFRSFSICYCSWWTQPFLSRGAR